MYESFGPSFLHILSKDWFLSLSIYICNSWQIDCVVIDWQRLWQNKLQWYMMYHTDTQHSKIYLQFLNKLLEIRLSGLVDDIEHLSTDSSDLAGLSIACGICALVLLLLGESNCKYTKNISICSSNINKGLNQSLPLADK